MDTASDKLLTLDETFDHLTMKTLKEFDMLELARSYLAEGYTSRAQELIETFYKTVALMALKYS